ncbi:1-pyrroline-5-carboxylate dehydrogenase [Vibrio spartinae]|uniref:Bifunctional proline dehydrogenase/pyrroline-5-carboxylate dehydrogenase n=1 Tax=Vibrio spartinae TaxID=1918945 RepID=A0A1N6M1Y8_9VIBR|nr:1-pyrroline-5-carboxylate dehydrogenase [Vibrio spartinae]QMV16083.1 bifunctional proline dehydrogenase/pyrroline-5-carboxylate dehydrogenase [Vibrio spartinae]SIO93411.1 bifunctional proline dehydrogenase/pyrroline-5-carboxylate dehydrogenase [Vibrio spartinae]
MVSKTTHFSDAALAWQQWNLTDFSSKSEHLLRLAQALELDAADFAQVITYHLNSARTRIAEGQLLVGPTGETNELYSSGRGVVVLLHKRSGVNASLAVVAQLAAALIAGNSILLCSDDTPLNSRLASALENSCFPVHLVQIVAVEAFNQIMTCDVRQVGMICEPQDARQVNQELSKRPGVIISPVIETDLDQLPMAHDAALVLRFITERTRTINITAIGGNASLLEMGSSNH